MENNDFQLENTESNLVNNTAFKVDLEFMTQCPLSGVEGNQYHYFEYIDNMGVRTNIRYFPTKNIMNIEKEYPQNTGGPSTRNINFYFNDIKAVVQGTDYCGKDEEDYPGMGEKQVDEIETKEIDHMQILFHKYIGSSFRTAQRKNYNNELGKTLDKGE